jgi:hypothetical protein
MLLFALTILLLTRERYWWIPPVFLLWANMHAQVVMGGIVLGIAFAASLADHAWARSDASKARAVRLGLVLALSAVATLGTPLGPRLWTYVLSANGRTGQDRVAEWDNAFRPLVSNGMFWLILALAVVMAVRRRDRLASWGARVPLLASAAMAPLAILSARSISFFVVATVPLLMTLLEFRTRNPIGEVPRWRGALATFSVVTAAAVALVWIAAPPKLAWRPVGPALADALRDCPGTLYNEYNEGAALTWWVPDVKVFVDNRLDPYPDDVIEASMGLDRQNYRATFDRYGIGCAYLPAGASLDQTLRDEGWQTIYEDDASVVLVPAR